jgi:DNA invertase Pin-like site-specific DNA recombinase
VTDRVVGYVRVSTAEQVTGFGLDVQRDAIREHCARTDLELVEILSDEAQSGSKGLDGRPGLATCIALIEEGDLAGLVVYRMDRLARDLLLQETIIAELRRAGGTVVSVTEPDMDSEDPSRVMVRQIFGAVAQYERALIRGRTMAGKAAKKAKGGYSGGRPRFGTAAQDGALVAVAEQQAVIARARDLRGDGLSLRAIVARLEEAEGHRFGLATVARMVSEDGPQLNGATAMRSPNPNPTSNATS